MSRCRRPRAIRCVSVFTARVIVPSYSNIRGVYGAGAGNYAWLRNNFGSEAGEGFIRRSWAGRNRLYAGGMLNTSASSNREVR